MVAMEAVAVENLRYHRRRLLRRSQADGLELLAECRKAGTPFALFLRGFGSERSHETFGNIGYSGDYFIRVHSDENRPAESAIRRSLGRSMPVFAVDTPSWSGVLPGIHRILVEKEGWVREVSSLIEEARHVLIYVETLSEGIVTELRLINRLRAHGRTLVIASSPGKWQELLSIKGAKRHIFGLPDPVFLLQSSRDLLWDGQTRCLCRQLCSRYNLPWDPLKPLPMGIRYLSPLFVLGAILLSRTLLGPPIGLLVTNVVAMAALAVAWLAYRDA